MFSEEEVKQKLKSKLENDGWEVEVAWGHNHGADIFAKKGEQHWIIEVKGPGSRPPMRVNYFLSILGETLQRMNDDGAKYSIAFPDMQQYRNLWNSLPHLAKERTGISLILVNDEEVIEELF